MILLFLKKTCFRDTSWRTGFLKRHRRTREGSRGGGVTERTEEAHPAASELVGVTERGDVGKEFSRERRGLDLS